MILFQESWHFNDFENHDHVAKGKHFPRYWPFVRRILQWPVNSPHKGQWRGALIFSFICARTNGWVNNRNAGDLRRHSPHHDVTVMCKPGKYPIFSGCTATSHIRHGIQNIPFGTEGFVKIFTNVNFKLVTKTMATLKQNTIPSLSVFW